MNRRSFLKRASLAVGAAAISLSMLRAPKPKKVNMTAFMELPSHFNTNTIQRMKVESLKSMDQLIINNL